MTESITFEEYLTSKKIDARKFESAESSLYSELKEEFDQVHPNSFTHQNLFIINPLRRKYLLVEESNVITKPKVVAKPKFKRPS